MLFDKKHFVILRNIKTFIPVNMEIKVLGTGCPNCKNLEKLVINTLAEMDIAADVTKEQDIVKIMGYGIMRTPGLVINGKVVVSGRIPSSKELREMIEQNK
jgi:small redox-active disulfide protein 2